MGPERVAEPRFMVRELLATMDSEIHGKLQGINRKPVRGSKPAEAEPCFEASHGGLACCILGCLSCIELMRYFDLF